MQSLFRAPVALALAAALLASCSDRTAARAAAAATGAADPARADPAPFVLEGTEVRTVPAPELGRDYRIYVSLPRSYATEPSRRYPVVFVTDADTQFPLVRSIARRLGHSKRHVQEFILVGLSYGVGETPEYSRRRDYTPSPGGDPNAVSDMPGRKPAFGEAEAYRLYVKTRVFPAVAARYRADMGRKVFVGQSYGALLGAHVLLAEPAMFEHYVLGSPSLWFDRRVMFAREAEHARTHEDLPADVYMAVGGYETVRPGSPDWRYNRSEDMVGDLQAFARALRSRGHPGLALKTEVLEGEDHLTAFPGVVTRGLMHALPPQA